MILEEISTQLWQVIFPSEELIFRDQNLNFRYTDRYLLRHNLHPTLPKDLLLILANNWWNQRKEEHIRRLPCGREGDLRSGPSDGYGRTSTWYRGRSDEMGPTRLQHGTMSRQNRIRKSENNSCTAIVWLIKGYLVA